jgi:hypothetical protein
MRFLIFSLILFVIPDFSIAATTDVATTEKILGHFRTGNFSNNCDIHFKVRGYYSGICSSKNKILWTYSGVWQIKGHYLNTLYTKSSLRSVPPGTKDKDKIIEIKDNYFIIENQSGRISKYVRNPEKELDNLGTQSNN